MAKITVKCPDCAREISVNIKTIDSLREELSRMTELCCEYKSKLAALELMNKSRVGNTDDLFNSLFGGFKK